jgi:hypothetical protein
VGRLYVCQTPHPVNGFFQKKCTFLQIPYFRLILRGFIFAFFALTAGFRRLFSEYAHKKCKNTLIAAPFFCPA